MIHKFIQFLIAQGKGTDHLAFMGLFLLTIDDTQFSEFHQTGCKHFRMYAQVFFIDQGIRNGIRHPTDAQLDTIPIVDVRGDHIANDDVFFRRSHIR